MGKIKDAPERPLLAESQISNCDARRGADPADPDQVPEEGRSPTAGGRRRPRRRKPTADLPRIGLRALMSEARSRKARRVAQRRQTREGTMRSPHLLAIAAAAVAFLGATAAASAADPKSSAESISSPSPAATTVTRPATFSASRISRAPSAARTSASPSRRRRRLGRNLTPDKETGLGDWTAEQIITAFTTGVRPDGRKLSPIMPYMELANLSKDDAQAIAAYLKSLPPVKTRGPGAVRAEGGSHDAGFRHRPGRGLLEAARAAGERTGVAGVSTKRARTSSAGATGPFAIRAGKEEATCGAELLIARRRARRGGGGVFSPGARNRGRLDRRAVRSNAQRP